VVEGVVAGVVEGVVEGAIEGAIEGVVEGAIAMKYSPSANRKHLGKSIVRFRFFD
jgi:hypothetical protein